MQIVHSYKQAFHFGSFNQFAQSVLNKEIIFSPAAHEHVVIGKVVWWAFCGGPVSTQARLCGH